MSCRRHRILWLLVSSRDELRRWSARWRTRADRAYSIPHRPQPTISYYHDHPPPTLLSSCGARQLSQRFDREVSLQRKACGTLSFGLEIEPNGDAYPLRFITTGPPRQAAEGGSLTPLRCSHVPAVGISSLASEARFLTLPDLLLPFRSACFCSGTILALSAVEDGISNESDTERRAQAQTDLRSITSALREVGYTWPTAQTSAAVLEGESFS